MVHNAIPVDEYPFRADKEDFCLFLGRVNGESGFVRDRLEELPGAIERAGELDPAACRRHVAGRFDIPTMTDGYEHISRRLAAVGTG